MVNYKTFAPYFAMMYKVYCGTAREFAEFVEFYQNRGWRFVGAVSVANDSIADNGAGDWEGSYTTTFVYFE